MAKRYSGNLQISVVYDDKNHYRTAVSRGGKLLWRGVVNPAPAGFGPGVAYDSPKAYDEIASSALSFADHEVGGVGDDAEYDEDLTGYLIRRSPRGKTAHHATKRRSTTKKSPTQLQREIDEALARSDTRAPRATMVKGRLTVPHGYLTNYKTGEQLRPATADEARRSRAAAKRDGGSGVIKVDGLSTYVSE